MSRAQIKPLIDLFAAHDADRREELHMLLDLAQDFAKNRIAPLDADADRDNAFPTPLWKELGEQGLLGITTDPEHGGAGLGYFAHLMVMEQISAASGSIGLSYVAHSNLCMNQIRLNATEEQKQKFLPLLASGDFVGGLAMSEPEAGSDIMSMALTAVKVDGGYILNGPKQWITNGGEADVLVVYARTAPDKLTAFLVEKDFAGFSATGKEDKMGMRGSGTWQLSFDNCFVPDASVLGAPDGGKAVLMSGLNYERLMLAGGALGLAQASMDIALEHTSQRKQFRRALVANQAVAHDFARMHAELSAARMFAYTTAAMADAGQTLGNDLAASVFFKASDTGNDITARCITRCGGMGYTKDMKLERIHRDEALYEIGGGARDIRLDIIARHIAPEYDRYARRVDRLLRKEFAAAQAPQSPAAPAATPNPAPKP